MARMNISEIIKDARQVIRFSEDSVPREAIVELLNDAVYAAKPNRGLSEPWRFILLDSMEAKSRLVGIMLEVGAELGRYDRNKARIKEQFADMAMSVPSYLIVVMQEHPDQTGWEDDFATTCCMIQNFSLLGWEKGIGMTWLKDDDVCDSPQFREWLDIHSGERAVSILSLGYYEDVPRLKERVPAAEKLTVL
ncbi:MULTISPECIES: nitroreductase family protein [Paenibacillus]|uniref:Nitroreductase n=1 Tax=Paenibacillus albilobatus TaxID=2716884 RepID=A0A919XJ34_9BACL|nr:MULTISPECIES: nitroreductase [Paenibacillus]GIO31415.1 nitroreductase [Paenibacillus albilobatus]